MTTTALPYNRVMRTTRPALSRQNFSQLAQTATIAMLGFGLGTAYLPTPILNLDGRVATISRLSMIVIPMVIAYFVFPEEKNRPALMPKDELLFRSWFGWMLAATTISMMFGVHDKWLTITGSTLSLIVTYFSLPKVAKPGNVPLLMAGLQCGTLSFLGYMLLTNKLVSADIGSSLISDEFMQTQVIHRNAVTQIALTSVAAGLAYVFGTTFRGKPLLTRPVQSGLHFAALALDLYVVYIVPGKGAWLSAAMLLATFFGLLIYFKRWKPTIAAGIAGALVLPALYLRISDYLLAYYATNSGFTFSNRIFLWQAALRTVAEKSAYIFGFGYDSAFEVSGKVFGEGLLHFHNEFINAYYCGGVPGALLLTAAFAATLYKIVRRIMQKRLDGIESYVFLLLVFVLIASRMMADVSLTTFGELTILWAFATYMPAGLSTATSTRRPRIAGPRAPLHPSRNSDSDSIRRLIFVGRDSAPTQTGHSGPQ